MDLIGNQFAQTIIGNNGANFLSTGGGAADILQGRSGSDTYRVFHADDRIVEAAGQGNDRVITSVDYTLTAGADIELFTTNSGGATVSISLIGNAYNQTIIGNNGANFLSTGGGLADILRGRGGSDTYRVYNANDQIIEAAGQGNDRVITSVSYELTAGADIETMQTNRGSSTVSLNLTGNEFNQTIIGNQGDNVINGGLENDILRGLGGNDTFVFDTILGSDNVDTITDFNVTNDQIHIDDAIFAGLSGGLGALVAGNFVANTSGTAIDSTDMIIYDTDSGELYYDADGNGAGASVQFAQLEAGLSLSALDFEII